MTATLPSGRVTFAFTDVVGSTRAIASHGEVFVAALRSLQATVAEHATSNRGAVVNTEGDGAFLAFPSAALAVHALQTLMRTVGDTAGPGLALQLRAGLHTGDAQPIAGDYLAFPVHVAARVASAAGAGQVLASQSVVDELPSPVGERLGAFVLRDIAEPVTLWRVAGDDAPPKATPTRNTNVALTRTAFVGRQDELAAIDALVAQPGIVTIVGTGGLGKTRLVSEYALRAGDGVPGGVWLVELASIVSESEIRPALASAIGMTGPPGADAMAAELNRRGHIVLVFDNCEHLIDPIAELVAELAASCPELRLLCTSREALDIPAERVLRLSPLATADGGPGDRASAAEQLFLDRATAAGADAEGFDRTEVSRLCQRLDGLPLALELAAARAPSMPIGELAAALDRGDVTLSRRGGADRQRSLDALVTWSLRLLDEAQRTALVTLAVFPGRFSSDMAASVLNRITDQPIAVVDALARRSLLDLDGSHFRMLVTVRDVVRQELDRRSELKPAAMAAVFEWCVQRSATRESGWGENPDEITTLVYSLDWALDTGRSGGGRVLERIAYWNLTNSTLAVSIELARRVLARPVPETADDIRLDCAAMRVMGGMAGNAEDASTDRVRRVVENARQSGDRAVYVKALATLASLLDRRGAHAEAQVLHDEYLAIARADDSVELKVSAALCDLGVSCHLSGDLDRAERLYRDAIDVSAPDDPNRFTSRSNLGEVLLDLDRPDAAAEQLRIGLREARGRPSLSAWILGLLVEAEARRRNGDIARALAAEAEPQLLRIEAVDPSVRYVLERMHAALAALSEPNLT